MLEVLNVLEVLEGTAFPLEHLEHLEQVEPLSLQPTPARTLLSPYPVPAQRSPRR